MIRPGASEGLSNAHYAAMGNYILMPQTGIPHAGISQTQATGGANTAQAHLQAVQNTQVPVTSHQMNPQSAGATAAGYRQQFQYPLHSVGQQLIVPQMQQFQMQQFPLLQSKFCYMGLRYSVNVSLERSTNNFPIPWSFQLNFPTACMPLHACCIISSWKKSKHFLLHFDSSLHNIFFQPPWCQHKW